MSQDDLLRFGTQGGVRYVCRDVFDKGTRICQSAVWEDDEIAWLPNKSRFPGGRPGEQGGYMFPFEGPDDEWEKLTAGGKRLWDE